MRDPFEKMYSLHIFLPDDIENNFNGWVSRTPYASWPSWGGHITIIPKFKPMISKEVIEKELSEICSVFPAFPVQFAQVFCQIHLLNPSLKLVYLSSPSDSKSYVRLARLQTLLAERLNSLDNRYTPHLSLSLGLEEEKALQVANAAKKANLKLDFTATNICLLEHLNNEVFRTKSFGFLQ
jgi:hypothetical protein